MGDVSELMVRLGVDECAGLIKPLGCDEFAEVGNIGDVAGEIDHTETVGGQETEARSTVDRVREQSHRHMLNNGRSICLTCEAMPHITIEYSANVGDHHDIDALVSEVHEAALRDGLPPLAGLRTRAAERVSYRVATGQDSFAFVAVIGRIGPGRSAEEKAKFLAALIDSAEAALRGGPLQIAFSAEIQEIDPEFRINRNHIRPYLEQQADEENHNG